MCSPRTLRSKISSTSLNSWKPTRVPSMASVSKSSWEASSSRRLRRPFSVSTGALLHRYAPIGEDFCKCFPSLGFVTGGGAGYDNIDTAAFSEEGVYYCNTPQAVAEPTADSTSILILSTLRNVISYDRNARKGKWREGLALGTNPRDAKWVLFALQNTHWSD